MSYIALIPKDPLDSKEHITLAWFKSDSQMEFIKRQFKKAQKILPIGLLITGHDLLGRDNNIPVALVAYNRMLWALMKFFDPINESKYEFNPHITKCRAFPLREIGDTIVFDRLELRD